MAGGREIKSKIKSVQNTRKVTRALEMVSASKIRKAQDRMKASRPYARLMRQVIGHIAKANTDYVHPYMVQRTDVRRVGYIVISTDRGLCGGLNSNLFRKLLGDIRKWQDQGVEVDIVAVGQKANTFFRRLKVNMVASVTHMGEKPQLEQLIVPVGMGTLGRIMDVLGRPIDEAGPIDSGRRACARFTAAHRSSTNCRLRSICSKPASRLST
jgi:F-type H+-transporting ATPase subunit gamma